MIFRPAWLRAISLCLFPVLVAAQGISPTAKICNVPYNSDPTIQDNVNYLLVSNQTDLDTAFAGCTTINGDILISNTYTGGFNLSELITFNGSIQTVDFPVHNTSVTRGLTFIALDNVQTLNTMFQIYSVPNLTSISMANATYVQYIQVTLEGGASLNFPELLNVTGLGLYGNFGSINFTHLTYIEGGMAIGYSVVANEDFDPDPTMLVQNPWMEINFPSLTYSATINIWGNIASLSFPLLETISGDQPDLFPGLSVLSGGLAIYALGNPVSVDFPKLSNCSSITISGMISGLSFDSLLTVNQLSMSPYTPMALTLGLLENATTINLGGNITGMDLNSLKYIGKSLYITSDVRSFDCTEAQHFWNVTIHNPKLDNCPAWDGCGFYCEGPTPTYVPPVDFNPTTSKKPLSGSAKAGIVVGAVLPTIIILVWLVNRTDKQLKANKPPPAYDIEMHNRRPRILGGERADGEVLPAYEPPPEAEEPDGPVNSVRAENAVGEESPSSPPGYEHATREGGSVSGGGAEEAATRDTGDAGH